MANSPDTHQNPRQREETRLGGLEVKFEEVGYRLNMQQLLNGKGLSAIQRIKIKVIWNRPPPCPSPLVTTLLVQYASAELVPPLRPCQRRTKRPTGPMNMEGLGGGKGLLSILTSRNTT